MLAGLAEDACAINGGNDRERGNDMPLLGRKTHPEERIGIALGGHQLRPRGSGSPDFL